MSIEFECSECGRRYTVDDSAAGKLGLCKVCGTKTRIPGVPAEAGGAVLESESGSQSAAPTFPGYAPPPEPAAPEAPPSAASSFQQFEQAPGPPGSAPTPSLPKRMLANRALAGQPCPICSRLIALGESVRNCELCGTAHHENCWQQHGGCSTATCNNAPLPEIAPQAAAPSAAPYGAGAQPGTMAPPYGPPGPPPGAGGYQVTGAYQPVGATKPCPFCGEQIAQAAYKCRFCNEYLTGAGRPPYMIQQRCGSATGSLVCGIISVLCIGVILGPIAIALGASAKSKIARSQGQLTGKGMATAGLVLGIIGTVIGVGGCIYQLSQFEGF